jgi:hypothetical protein
MFVQSKGLIVQFKIRSYVVVEIVRIFSALVLAIMFCGMIVCYTYVALSRKL